MEKIEELNAMLAVFKSRKIEHAYRHQGLEQDKHQFKVITIIAAISLSLFIFSDYKLFGSSLMFYKLLTARSIFVFFAIVLAANLKKIDDETIFDIFIFVFALFLSGLVFYINMSRPADYLSHAVGDIVYLLAIYLILPYRFMLQFITAIIFTAGNIIIIIYIKSSHPLLGNNIIIASYLFINLLGISVGRQIHINKRKQFELYNNERELRVEYQNTLDELVTLRGIIPICANCKQIRDDQGYWNQLEAYIQKHSLAKFSHGICPQCSKKLYPGIDIH
jgi:hypothetical protein